MSHKASQGSAAKARQSPSFKHMTPRQKLFFVCKLAVSIISFGFLYPNLMD